MIPKGKKSVFLLTVILALFSAGLITFLSPNSGKGNSGLNSACSLDNLGGASKDGVNIYSVSSLTSSVTFQGWISNPPAGQAPDAFSISLADEMNYIQWTKESRPDFPRPDVLAAYKAADSMLVSGFNVSANLVDLSPGEYTILLQGQYSGNSILCSNVNKLIIKG